MAVHDEYLDVLQNIEFAIVSTYREFPAMTDYEVMRALEAVIDGYKAESRGHAPREVFLSPMETALCDAVRRMCEWRLGRGDKSEDVRALGPAPEPVTIDEILLCLKKILNSVNKWNRSGGRTGYLTFIVQYVR